MSNALLVDISGITDISAETEKHIVEGFKKAKGFCLAFFREDGIGLSMHNTDVMEMASLIAGILESHPMIKMFLGLSGQLSRD